jgi:hypothetical protein
MKDIVAKKRIGGTVKNGETVIREMIYWNAVNPCDPEKCGCSSICKFLSENDQLNKCEVIYEYMSSVLDMLLRNYPKEMTEDVAYRIGLHLIPLYKILCRLKMAEFAAVDVTTFSSRGDIKITPLFKEIRDTIQAIERTWRAIGFDVSKPDQIRPLKQVGFFNGKSYYEVIEGGANVQALEAKV